MNTPYQFKTTLRYPGEFGEWLEHPENETQQVLWVQVFKEEEKVGQAFFGYLTKSRGGHLACLEIFIKTEYRRLGLATKIYNLAEEYFSHTLQPYPGHSGDATLFWKSRKE